MAKLHFKDYNPNQIVLFPQRMDEDIDETDPVRIISYLVDCLNLDRINRLYNRSGRSPYHPKMMLKVIIYAYLNNIYSCRRIESLLRRDTYFMWLAGRQRPDFITINRFRNRVKDEIDKVFTQLVVMLVERGFISLDVEYVDGTKIESKANRYTFVWRKRVETSRARLMEKIKVLLSQIDDCVAQDNAEKEPAVEITPEALDEIVSTLKANLEKEPAPEDKEKRRELRERRKQISDLEEHRDKLAEYDGHLETMDGRMSYSKTDHDATFMRMKEDAMKNGQTKPGYNLQLGTNNQFILDYGLYPDPTDTLTFPDFMTSFKSRYGRMPNAVVADAGYGSDENYEVLRRNGIEPYVKYGYFNKEQRPRYTPDAFQANNMPYNKEGDFCVCPMGQHMERVGTRRVKSASGYISEVAMYRARRCEGCPLRCLCFDGKGNRTVGINHRLNEFKQEAREKLTSEEGIKYRGRRCIDIEPVFGQIKWNMGYKRFRHFGKDKVLMDIGFFAIAFNIKKLCKCLNNMGIKSVSEAFGGLINAFSSLFTTFPVFFKQETLKIAA